MSHFSYLGLKKGLEKTSYEFKWELEWNSFGGNYPSEADIQPRLEKKSFFVIIWNFHSRQLFCILWLFCRINFPAGEKVFHPFGADQLSSSFLNCSLRTFSRHKMWVYDPIEIFWPTLAACSCCLFSGVFHLILSIEYQLHREFTSSRLKTSSAPAKEVN